MFKTYNFWIKLVAVLILIVRIVGDRLGFYVDSELYMDIATALASVLVILGVIQVPAATSNTNNKNSKEGVEVREDITETLKGMAEKLKGLTDNFNSVKLAPITTLIDEILAECSGEGLEKAEDVSAGEEETKLEEALSAAGGSEADCDESELEVVEEELLEEEIMDEGLDEYLIRTELEGECSENIKEAHAFSDESEPQEVIITTEGESEAKSEVADGTNKSHDDEEVLLALKEKIKALIENNLDEIISSVV